jgi:hypothetical protein
VCRGGVGIAKATRGWLERKEKTCNVWLEISSLGMTSFRAGPTKDFTTRRLSVVFFLFFILFASRSPRMMRPVSARCPWTTEVKRWRYSLATATAGRQTYC